MMPIFGYSEREMEMARREAQSAAMKRFLASVRYHEGHERGREVLLEMIESLHPRSWEGELANRLVILIDHLAETNTNLEHNLERERLQRKRLQRELKGYQQDPLQDRIGRLTAKRNRCYEEVMQLRARARRLEEALEHSQKMYQVETQRLKTRVAELNRIIVKQEELLSTLKN